jgi:hypothetical protein
VLRHKLLNVMAQMRTIIFIDEMRFPRPCAIL